MTKNDLTKELAVSEGLHLSTAVKAVDGIIRILKDSLSKGEDVTLRGFGTLSVVECAERKGVHFATKEPIIVPAHKAVRFRTSSELKGMLNDGSMD